MTSQENTSHHRVDHEWDGAMSLSTRLVKAVAEASGADPKELPPLYEEVDPDALDRLFAPGPEAGKTNGTVSFEFAGHSVTLHATGEIIVRTAE